MMRRTCTDECSICLERLYTNDTTFCVKSKVLHKRGENSSIPALKCGHKFHNSCLRNWFTSQSDSSNKCPMCRQEIVFKKTSKDFLSRRLRFEDEFEFTFELNVYDSDDDNEEDGLQASHDLDVYPDEYISGHEYGLEDVDIEDDVSEDIGSQSDAESDDYDDYDEEDGNFSEDNTSSMNSYNYYTTTMVFPKIPKGMLRRNPKFVSKLNNHRYRRYNWKGRL